MFPTLVYSHWFWAAMMFLAFVAVYRKYRRNQNEMVKNFALFFLVWSIPFFGLMSTMLAAGIYLNNNLILNLGYVIPHIFAFISVGYLWKVQSSINFPKYQKLFWLFVAYGVGIGLFGLMNPPGVTFTAGNLSFGTSLFNKLIPLGMTVSAVLIAGSSFYSAYVTKGETRRKLTVLGLATILSLVVASTLQNLGFNKVGELVVVVWVSLFMSVAYWSELKAKYEALRGA